MRILLVNQYAGSLDLGMEFRPFFFAREWQRAGHEVVFVAGSYSHLREKNPTNRSRRWTSVHDDVTFEWLWTPHYETNGLRRAANIATFATALSLSAASLARDYHPDLVISSSTHNLDYFGAHRLARISGAVHVHEVHDLWPLTLIEAGGMSKRHPWIQVLQLAEDASYRGSDAVVSIPPDTEDYMASHGLDRSKFFHIPNGVAREDWDSAEPLPPAHEGLLRNIERAGDLIIGYAGTIGPLNELNSLLQAARRLESGAQVVLVGDGLAREDLQREFSSERIHFLPRVSKRQVPTLIRRFDVCFSGLWRGDSRTSGTSINKLFDYMMAGKPVLFGADATSTTVSDSRAGLVVPAEDVDAVHQAIMKFVAMSAAERESMGERGRDVVLSNFEYQGLALRFLQEVKSRTSAEWGWT